MMLETYNLIFYLFPEVCLTLISFTSLSYIGPAHSLSLLSRTLVLCINNKDTTIKIFTNFHLELENGNHKMGISDDVEFKNIQERKSSILNRFDNSFPSERDTL